MGNLDSSDRTRLPPSIKDKVCMCPPTAKDFTRWGWKDPELPVPKQTYWIHLTCGRPNHHHCVWKCDDCDRLFVPKSPYPYPDFLVEVLCSDCGGPE